MKHICKWGSSFVIGIFLLFASLPVAQAAYGESPTFAGSTTNAPSCGSSAPKMVWPFWAKSAGGGAVDLTWGKINDVSSWTVAYGYAPHTYIYGISNFGNGDSRSLRVGSLPSGIYYFAMRANNGCKPGPFSNEWRVVVGRGARIRNATVMGDSIETIPTPEPEAVVNPTESIPEFVPTAPPPEPTSDTVVAPNVKVSWWQRIINSLFRR